MNSLPVVLNLLAPVTVLFDATLQATWTLDNSWDSLLPANSHKKLQELQNLFLTMKTITLSLSLPRKPLNRELPTRSSVQLHTFTDASLIGMSTLLYIRVKFGP